MRAALSFSALLCAAFNAGSLEAQLIGHPPSESPFQDVRQSQQFTLSGGWFAAVKDPGGVGPQAAPIFSFRHDINVGGPAWLTTRYSTVFAERNVINPTLGVADRVIETRGVQQHVGDIGLTIALTGRKSYRSFVPNVSGGIGLASDFAGVDAGGYGFGTKFAFTYGGGVRYVRPNGWSVRADLTNYFYQFRYPETYFFPSADGTPVLDDVQLRSAWRSNWALTTGISLPVFR